MHREDGKLLKEQGVPGSGSGFELLFGLAELYPIIARLWNSPKYSEAFLIHDVMKPHLV